MKKNLLVLCGVVLAFVSCDKVDRPIVEKKIVVGSKYVIKTNKDDSNIKKFLFEEYTGQRCPNCPDGARIIENSLVPVFGSKMVVIAVHQGIFFAKPTGKYTNDFRTVAGEAWGAAAGFGIDQWPTGIINRKNYQSNGRNLPRSKWTSVAPLTANDAFIVKLDVRTEYDTTVRALDTYVTASFKIAYQNDLKISVVYLEDGIVGLQDDAGVEVEDYEFENMLRGDINGTWGTDLKIGPAAVNDSVKVSFPGFGLPLNSTTILNGIGHSIDDKKVSVVVFAYDALTREVLQVEKVKIR